MAGSAEAQRRHRWRERQLLIRLRRDLPDVWAAWWADTEADWAEGPGRIEASASKATDGVEALRRALQDP
jgi:hypothetical protein